MIGFIDSGVGGINVLSECSKIFNEDFIYLCDNKNAPYGNKSKKKLYKITKNNIDYLIKKYNVDIVVLACNTLSFCVGKRIKKEYSIPIILMQMNENKINKLKKDVLFFATKNTIKNNKIIQDKLKNNANYFALYIKNLPKMIDNNLNNLNNLKKILKKHLKNKKYSNIKTVVLGCTHFRLIKKQICDILKNVEFYEYEKDVAILASRYVKCKPYSTYEIKLTSYDYPLYVELKCYMNNCTNRD